MAQMRVKLIMKSERCKVDHQVCKKTNAGEGVEKRKPPTLLAGMQTGAATMENSVEVP